MHHAIHFVFEVSVFPGPSGSLNPPAIQCTGRGSDEGFWKLPCGVRQQKTWTWNRHAELGVEPRWWLSWLQAELVWPLLQLLQPWWGHLEVRWPRIHPDRNHSSWETQCYVHAPLSLWQSHMTCLYPHFFSWRTWASGNDLSPIAALSELIVPPYIWCLMALSHTICQWIKPCPIKFTVPLLNSVIWEIHIEYLLHVGAIMSEADSFPISISPRWSWETRVANQTAFIVLGQDRDRILLGKLMVGGPDLKAFLKEIRLKKRSEVQKCQQLMEGRRQRPGNLCTKVRLLGKEPWPED